MTPEMLQAISDAISALQDALKTKAGWKTSEFWMTVAGHLVGLGLEVGSFFTADPRVQIAMLALGAVGQVLTTLGYQTRRTQAKATPPAAPTLAVAADLAMALQKTGVKPDALGDTLANVKPATLPPALY